MNTLPKAMLVIRIYYGKCKRKKYREKIKGKKRRKKKEVFFFLFFFCSLKLVLFILTLQYKDEIIQEYINFK